MRPAKPRYMSQCFAKTARAGRRFFLGLAVLGLMERLAQWAPLLAAGVLLGALLTCGAADEAVGARVAQARARTAAAELDAAAWKAKYDSASRDVRREIDTVRVRGAATLRLLRVLERATDTVTVTDTVEVRAALAAADTTIRGCLRLADDCGAALDAAARAMATKDTLAAALRAQLKLAARAARPPSLASRVRGAVPYVAGGLVAGALLVK